MRFLASHLFAILSVLPLGAQALSTDAAGPIFREAARLARRDHGALWGRSLEGPMLLVDPRSRALVANAPDREGRLKAEGALWRGTLPREVNVANTATEWAGVRWTMVMWPLPADQEAEQGVLLMHELYHRIQPALNLLPSGPDCGHLDTRQGRIWLRLEFRALRAALEAQGEARRAALRAALAFRAKRRALFPQAAPAERALELNEGLAEYTGVRLALAPGEARVRTARQLEKADGAKAFMRSFCYFSGPALGLLLDEADPGWRAFLNADSDLGDRVASAWKLTPLEASPMEEAAMAFGGKALAAEEQARETTRAARHQEILRRFKEGPVLEAPMGNIEFNPGAQESVEGLGIFNPTLRLVGPWGILSVQGGCVLAPDWSHVKVEAPASLPAAPLAGPGWTLDLNPGWRLVPGARKGDWGIRQEVKPGPGGRAL